MPVRPSSAYPILIGLIAAACDPGEPDPASTGGDAPGQPAPLLIETDKGPVEGQLVGSTRAFLGIPYAAPPTGERRWRAPAPHEPWTETRRAVEPGPACAQMRLLAPGFDPATSEDCLTANVWTPARPASAPLSVLVWIHGGGFESGSSREADYDGRVLSETTGAVVVTLNYRLGPLGFLALPALQSEDPDHPSTGAYGLEDQRAALAWVKANIGAFGGDPDNVTLIGQSAGAVSTCMHLVSPPSKGLFQRAIIESGPCDGAIDEAAGAARGERVVEALGCADAPSVLGCLRDKSTEEVMTALTLSNDPFGGDPRWLPVIDGWNLPDLPINLLEAGRFEEVPTIVGSNADEATLIVALAGGVDAITGDAELEAFLEKLAPGRGQDVAARYPSAAYGSAAEAALAAAGDARFVCTARRAARAIARAGVPAYLYHFTYAPPTSLLGDLGSFHSAEIKFVFGNPTLLLPEPLTEDEIEMSRAIMGYWSRHAQHGDPNGGGALEWPRYDAETDENLVVDLTLSRQAGLKEELCDMWDALATEGREP